MGNSGLGTSEPIVKVPSGEDITIRSNGWDFVINDGCVKINNKKTGKTVFKINDTGVLIGPTRRTYQNETVICYNQ